VLGMEWNFLEPRVCGERGSAHWREFAEALVAMLQFHLPPRSHFLASDVHPMCTPAPSLTTTLITELLTNPLVQSGSTEDPGDQSTRSGPVHHTGQLSMAWKRSGV
jgi:hypothetical protein